MKYINKIGLIALLKLGVAWRNINIANGGITARMNIHALLLHADKVCDVTVMNEL